MSARTADKGKKIEVSEGKEGMTARGSVTAFTLFGVEHLQGGAE